MKLLSNEYLEMIKMEHQTCVDKVQALRIQFASPTDVEVARFLDIPEQVRNLAAVNDDTLLEIYKMKQRADQFTQKYVGKTVTGADIANLFDSTVEGVYVEDLDLRLSGITVCT